MNTNKNDPYYPYENRVTPEFIKAEVDSYMRTVQRMEAHDRAAKGLPPLEPCTPEQAAIAEILGKAAADSLEAQWLKNRNSDTSDLPTPTNIKP